MVCIDKSRASRHIYYTESVEHIEGKRHRLLDIYMGNAHIAFI